jgi:hypothetical protein
LHPERSGCAFAARALPVVAIGQGNILTMNERSISPAALIATIKVNLLRNPLWTPEAAQQCLEVKREQLVAMIQSGEIAWAWNIGRAGATRSELRILAACVIERNVGIIPQIGATRNLKLAEVVNLILPAMRPTLRGRELQKLFMCNPDTIRKLRLAGNLEMVPEVLDKHGPNSSPRYTRDSLVKFFARRRIT